MSEFSQLNNTFDASNIWNHLPNMNLHMPEIPLPNIPPIDYENSMLKDQADDIADRIVDPINRHIDAVEAIAKAAESQSQSAQDIALSLREHTNAMKEQISVMKDDLILATQKAVDADHDAKFSKTVSIIAIIISVLVPLLQFLLR